MPAVLTRSGKDCLRGHHNPLRYSNGNCKDCLREKNALLQSDPEFAQRKRDRENARYQANADKHNERSRDYRNKNRNRLNKMSSERYAKNREERIAKAQEYRRENPEKVREANKRYYHKNKETRRAKNKDWIKRNAESHKDRQQSYQRKHYAENKEYYYVKSAKAKSRLRKSTPGWADLNKIAEIYRQAAAMSTDEVKYSVDHIIPLKGKMICGLHVENNLQIMTLEENKRKGNRWNGYHSKSHRA